MENKEMMQEFATNCEKNLQTLAEHFKAYDLAKLGYEMQEERIKEVYNAVLVTNAFYASEDYDRAGIKAGDRITSAKNMYFLHDEEFSRLLAMTTAELANEGITDENGTYLTDWLGIKGDARRALVDFIISDILPDALKPQFEAVKLNIVQTDKLLNVIRPMVAKTA